MRWAVAVFMLACGTPTVKKSESSGDLGAASPASFVAWVLSCRAPLTHEDLPVVREVSCTESPRERPSWSVSIRYSGEIDRVTFADRTKQELDGDVRRRGSMVLGPHVLTLVLPSLDNSDELIPGTGITTYRINPEGDPTRSFTQISWGLAYMGAEPTDEATGNTRGR